MRSTMMQYPLTLTPLLERAGKLFPNVEVVSRLPGETTERSSYRQVHQGAVALAAALQKAGLRPGERVATLMWNHRTHLEAYFGIPVIGGVIHTLNLRLHPDELSYIVNHAQDRFLLVDDVLLPLFTQIKSKVELERVIVVRHTGSPLPEGTESYADFAAPGNAGLDLAQVHLDEEDAAAMCYTSGTTGKPKGVVYSHRALVLHSFAISLPDHFDISRNDVVLPAMSMFHANAWGLPYAAIMAGAKLVFPGPNLQAEALLDLLTKEKVTLTGAVPTVWLAVLQALEQEPGRWTLTEGMRILVAGSACPETLFRRFDRFGVTVIQPWGMTETTPMGTFSTLKPHMRDWPEDKRYEVRAKQGLPSPFFEIRAAGTQGEIPWDGEAVGELQVRGPWVTGSYHNMPQEGQRWTEDGWLRTGDVVNIDPEGYIKITDREKDLIKSGGEWISSVDLENALVAHPAVQEAAVIAVAHPRWQERPLALIVYKEKCKAENDELRELLLQSFAKWQLPDEFIAVDQLPHTSTGKLLKTELRQKYKDRYAARKPG